MNTSKQQYDAVTDFMIMGSQEVNTTFKFQPLGIANFRIRLIEEEINGKNEMIYCSERDDAVGVLDGMCDVLYVAHGAAATFGAEVTMIDWNHMYGIDVNVPMDAHTTLRNNRKVQDTLEQFKRGIQTGDQTVITDGLNNLIWSIFVYAKASNFDLPAAFAEVHASNMSKFCATEEEAEHSIAVRQEEGDDKYNDVYVAPVGNMFAIKRTADNKILKGLGYFEPNLEPFVGK